MWVTPCLPAHSVPISGGKEKTCSRAAHGLNILPGGHGAALNVRANLRV